MAAPISSNGMQYDASSGMFRCVRPELGCGGNRVTTRNATGGTNMFVANSPGGGFAPTSTSAGGVGGVLTGVATTLAGALATRIAGQTIPAPNAIPLGGNALAAARAQEPAVIRSQVVGQAGIAYPTACGCKPRPGTCNVPRSIAPDFIGPDFLGIGNGCGDPCYPVVRYRRNTGEQYCAPPNRKPRMNPLNPQAARRATRRLSSMAKQMKRVQATLKKIAR